MTKNEEDFPVDDIYECAICGFIGNGYELLKHVRDKHSETVLDEHKHILNSKFLNNSYGR